MPVNGCTIRNAYSSTWVVFDSSADHADGGGTIGGTPFVPHFQGREHVITSNEVFDLEPFPQRLVVVGGGYIATTQTGGRPIEQSITPEGTPQWGSGWKKAVAKNYLSAMSVSTHGAVMSHRGNYLDLDPTYRDVYGRPLMRMTFDYTDNEHRMSDYLTDRAHDIAKAMKARELKVNRRKGSWDVVPYQTTHNTGGAIMGTDPATSAVNRYLQSWDVPNLFVIGASAFPQNAGYNPTGTLAALSHSISISIKL